MTETPVAASAGKFKPKPAAPPEAKTLKPDGITLCEPAVTLTSRAPTVAPAAIVIGTDKEVALLAVIAPVVMPLVPLTPGGMVNSTRLEAEKLVLLPVMVRVVVAFCAAPPGVILVILGAAPPLALPTLIVKFLVVLATGVALSATLITIW